MAVTNAGSTSLSFTNIPVGIQVTKITDSSADWSSVSNSTYFYDKGDKLVHYKNSGGVVLELFSAGGLTYFTEAENTSAPNTTVYVDSLTAAGSTTNVDAAVVPKGQGAFLLQIPNNATSGGNKRGLNATDLQTIRSSASQVASGEGSFAAGSYNTSSGLGASTLGAGCVGSGTRSFAVGDGSTSSGDRSVAMSAAATSSGNRAISIGASSTASGNYSVALQRSAVASDESATAIGDGATASGALALSLGYASLSSGVASNAIGAQSSTFGIYGRTSISGTSYNGTTNGDCQKSIFILRIRTTDATTTVLRTNAAASPGTTNQVILSNQSAYRFKGTIIGKKSGTTDIAAWDIDGLIVRGANAAATTLNISNVTLVQNTPAWGTPALSADTTNGGLKVEVTGAISTNIQWVATVETTEVIYA